MVSGRKTVTQKKPVTESVRRLQDGFANWVKKNKEKKQALARMNAERKKKQTEDEYKSMEGELKVVEQIGDFVLVPELSGRIKSWG